MPGISGHQYTGRNLSAFGRSPGSAVPQLRNFPPGFSAFERDRCCCAVTHSPVTNSVTTKGLLPAEAEAKGFRLNAVFQESLLICVQAGWDPECRSTRFHVCLTTFQMKPNRELDAGNWMVQAGISVSQVLASELHQLMPDDPANLMSQAGIHLLETSFPSWAGETVSQR